MKTESVSAIWLDRFQNNGAVKDVKRLVEAGYTGRQAVESILRNSELNSFDKLVLNEWLKYQEAWEYDEEIEIEEKIETKTTSQFDEEFKHMVEMIEALKDIAAAARERNMWLVIEVNESDEKYQKIRIDDIKRRIDWYNGDVSISGISPTPSVFSSEQWATRKIMTTAEVLGL